MNKSTIKIGQAEQVLNNEQKVDNKHVSPSIANVNVGRSQSSDAKFIFGGIMLMILLSAVMMLGVTYYPTHKLIVTDEYGHKVGELESKGYNSVYDLAREYRIAFYEKNGVQPETYYKSKLQYNRVH